MPEQPAVAGRRFLHGGADLVDRAGGKAAAWCGRSPAIPWEARTGLPRPNRSRRDIESDPSRAVSGQVRSQTALTLGRSVRRITGRVFVRRATSTKPARSNIVFAP